MQCAISITKHETGDRQPATFRPASNPLHAMRFLFEITYRGTHYHGWQSQHNATGIQQVIEETMTKLLREEISIVGSGRTDTGVHCVQQFFHADINSSFEADNLIIRMNSFLPRDIAVRSVRKIKSEASARYDAYERTYQYHITRSKDPLKDGFSLYFFKPLDVDVLQRGAAILSGKHDFECFSKVKTDVNHFIC